VAVRVHGPGRIVSASLGMHPRSRHESVHLLPRSDVLLFSNASQRGVVSTRLSALVVPDQLPPQSVLCHGRPCVVVTDTHVVMADGESVRAFRPDAIPEAAWYVDQMQHRPRSFVLFLGSGALDVSDPACVAAIPSFGLGLSQCIFTRVGQVSLAAGRLWFAAFVPGTTHLSAEPESIFLPVHPVALHRTARADVLVVEALGVVLVVTLRPQLRVAASYASTGVLSMRGWVRVFALLIVSVRGRPDLHDVRPTWSVDGGRAVRVPLHAAGARAVCRMVARAACPIPGRVPSRGAAADPWPLQRGVGAEHAADGPVGVGDSGHGVLNSVINHRV
jgi:hypothetical protein